MKKLVYSWARPELNRDEYHIKETELTVMRRALDTRKTPSRRVELRPSG